jgi:hypothetical protein
MKASLSYEGSMDPEPSLSNISKACLMSLTYSKGIVIVTYSSALNDFLYGPFVFGGCALGEGEIDCDFLLIQI